MHRRVPRGTSAPDTCDLRRRCKTFGGSLSARHKVSGTAVKVFGVNSLTLASELRAQHSHLTVLGGYRSADNGSAAANSTDNAVTFGVNWMVSQNVGLHWIFTKFSGSAYATGQGPMRPGGSGNMLNTLMLSAGF